MSENEELLSLCLAINNDDPENIYSTFEFYYGNGDLAILRTDDVYTYLNMHYQEYLHNKLTTTTISRARAIWNSLLKKGWTVDERSDYIENKIPTK